MKRFVSTTRLSTRCLERVRIHSSLPVTLLLIGLTIPVGTAQPAKASDDDVKAAYLFNFGKFVRQGQSPRSSFDICVIGRDSMGKTVDELAAKENIDGLRVHVRQLGDITQAKECAIVYFRPSENNRLREDLALLPSPEALTVGDAPDFLDRGGMIQFLLVDNHVRFSVNLNAVNHAHLILSSELLRVALAVTGKQSGELP